MSTTDFAPVHEAAHEGYVSNFSLTDLLFQKF
jgi:hypothetical protein